MLQCRALCDSYMLNGPFGTEKGMVALIFRFDLRKGQGQGSSGGVSFFQKHAYLVQFCLSCWFSFAYYPDMFPLKHFISSSTVRLTRCSAFPVAQVPGPSQRIAEDGSSQGKMTFCSLISLQPLSFTLHNHGQSIWYLLRPICQHNRARCFHDRSFSLSWCLSQLSYSFQLSYFYPAHWNYYQRALTLVFFFY